MTGAWGAPARRAFAFAVVAFAVAGCGGSQHSASGLPVAKGGDRPIGEDVLALLPSGADAIVDVDVAQLDSWATARRLIALLPPEGRARVAKIAADPLAQLNAIAVAVFRVGTPESDSVTVARGELDWDKLKQTIDGGADAEYHGAALVDGPNGESLARLTPTVFAFGSRVLVRRVCDVAQKNDEGFRTAVLDAKLREALGHAPTAKLGRPAIMAALVPTQPMRERMRKERWDAAADLDWGALSFAVGDGFDIGMVAGAHGPIEATTLMETMKKRAAELKGQVTVRMLGLSPYIEPFMVVAKESEVHVAYRLTDWRVDQLVTRLEQMQSLGRKKAAAQP